MAEIVPDLDTLQSLSSNQIQVSWTGAREDRLHVVVRPAGELAQADDASWLRVSGARDGQERHLMLLLSLLPAEVESLELHVAGSAAGTRGLTIADAARRDTRELRHPGVDTSAPALRLVGQLRPRAGGATDVVLRDQDSAADVRDLLGAREAQTPHRVDVPQRLSPALAAAQGSRLATATCP